MKFYKKKFSFFALWTSCLMILFICITPKANATSPLMTAITNKNLTQIKSILNSKTGTAQLNITDKRGLSPLDIALYETPAFIAPDIVQLLLKNGAKPGKTKINNLLTLSRLACSGGNDQDWSIALANTQVDGRLPNGFSPFLWTATCNQDSEKLKLLIKAGADPQQNLPPDGIHYLDIPAPNALLLAAKYNPSIEVINTLIQMGANLESRTYLGRTPLIEACEHNLNPGVALALIEAGANVNASDNVSTTPFLVAAKKSDALPLLEKLKEKGADVFAVDDSGSNALHMAAEKNTTLEVFPFLLKQGLPLNKSSSKNHEGVTPLIQAVRYNSNPDVIHFLLEAGADITSRDTEGLFAWDDLSAERMAWLKQNKVDRPPLFSIERKLLGRHMFSLQWISTEKYGEAEITKDDAGHLFVKAKQALDGNVAILNGQITIVDERTFIVNGQLMTRVSYINGGASCPRSGKFTFKTKGKRKYWRMQEMQNPCESVIDYVDIYF